MTRPIPFQKLRELDPALLRTVDAELLAGTSPGKVGAWLQGIGQLTVDRPDTLKRALHRYRASLRQQAPAPAGPFDALAELEQLARVQKGRLERLLARPDHDALAGLVQAETRLLADILRGVVTLQYARRSADA